LNYDRLTFTASCAVSAHYALLVYSALSKAADFLLSCMVFSTGVLSILLFSMSKYTYENKPVFFNLMIAGVTTFKASLAVAVVSKIFASVFRWAVGLAFCLGGLSSMRLKRERDYAIRNAIYITMNTILNIIFDLL